MNALDLAVLTFAAFGLVVSVCLILAAILWLGVRKTLQRDWALRRDRFETPEQAARRGGA